MQQHLLQLKAKNWSTVIEYAESIRDGKKVACLELKQAVDRFFRDLDNPEYEVNPKAPEFCIQIIEKTIKHQQGERIDALISASLIKNIFFKNSPLHDGAMVIADDRIAAARCVLPSTEREVPMEFGMRHRAALGASEITDALVIVVSEERGTISIARKGHISRDISPAHLQVLLRKGLSV